MKYPNNHMSGIFSDAERYRIVWFLGWTAVIINLTMLGVQLIAGRATEQSIIFFSVFIISLLIIMALVKRQSRFSIEIFFITVEILTPMIIYGIGVLRTPAVSIYIMVIFIMGLLEGKRGAVAALVMSTISLVGVGYALYGGDTFTGEHATAITSQALTFIFTTALVGAVNMIFASNELELLKFKNLVQQSPLSMVIFNLNGKVEYINQTFTEVTGFTEEDVRHISAHDFTLSTFSKEQYEDCWKTIRSGQVWKTEVISTTKFGKSYHEKIIIRPILNAKGQIIYFTAINENIDKKKRSDIALRHAHDDMEAKLDEIILLKNSLQEQSIHDSLTGLYNRRFFNEVVDREISRAERDKANLSLIVLDIDHFKLVNDSFGHMAGDLVLRDLARYLEDSVRKMDIVCRYGGEEFVIVMPGASARAAKDRAEALRKGIAGKNIIVTDHAINITCSFGICTYPDLASTIDQLLSRADIAMYACKQAGRNHCLVWNDEMSEATMNLANNISTHAV